MENIKPFIDLGWHTVPLKGVLKRLEDGTKTIPSFEDNWRNKYQQECNSKVTKLGGAITGKVSGIIAIDCDNENTYQLFKSLDPDYKFHFVSKGKGKLAGTIIYKFDEELPYTFSIQTGNFALDIYSNNGFIYLATDNNQTKEHFELCELKEMPVTVKSLLLQLHELKNKAPAIPNTSRAVISSNTCLAPLVNQMVETKKYLPTLFRVITPKDFRSCEDYAKNGHLHPNQIPEGRGSEYLSKIAAILGTDISIDIDLFVSALNFINSLWDNPIEQNRLDKTIIDPIISGRSNINGVTIWRYDEEWDRHRLVLHSKRSSTLEACFDDKRGTYFVVDVSNEFIKTFGAQAEFYNYLCASTVGTPKRAEIISSLPVINTGSNPGEDFGFTFNEAESVRELNTFRSTAELNILKNPEEYSQYYKRPTTLLRYLESLIPEEPMRNFVLKFLKRKLTTFEYSPVALYFLGVSGSGKDTFVQILERIIPAVAKPTVKLFLETNNSWLLDNYFGHLDEYGNQLTKMSEKEEALGRFKTYTGSNKVDIRMMREDSFSYVHNMTFILTANKNPFGLDEDDRRMALIHTPNKLASQQWVKDLGGMFETHKRIMEEIKDFCYYLATEIDMASGDEYMEPPVSESKNKLIADSMFAAQKLSFALSKGMLEYIKDICLDFGIDSMVNAIRNKKITSEELEELYDAMTDNNGDPKALQKYLRQYNVPFSFFNLNGRRFYRLDIFEDEPMFEPVEEESNESNVSNDINL